jgi:hypothetical protein
MQNDLTHKDQAHLQRRLLLLFALLVGSVAVGAEQQVDWSLDTNEVMVGGPVCLTFTQLPQRLWKNVEVQISGHDSLHPDLRGDGAQRDKVICLLWRASPEEVLSNSPNPYRIQPIPLFDEAGTVTIGVTIGGQSYGERQLNVVPLVPGAKPAIDRLYPMVDTTSRERLEKLAWADAIMSTGEKVSFEKLQWLRQGRQDVATHPGWRDIASALLWQSELRFQLADLSNRAKPTDASQETASAHRARLAKVLTEKDANEFRRIAALARGSTPKNPFAQLTLNWTRDTLRHVERGSYGYKVDLPQATLPAGPQTQPASSRPNDAYKRIGILVPPGASSKPSP